MRHVPALREGEPLHLVDMLEERCDHLVLRLVVAAVEEEYGHGDLVQVGDHTPVF